MTDASTRHAPKMRAAILISGRGSNMKSLVEAARAPDYPVEFVTIISNRPDAAGLAWARDQGLPALGLDHKLYQDRAHFESQLDGVLRAAKVELVCLAGFMRLMTPAFVERWRNRMLNIHPSLLPAFKGLDTHARALAIGARFAGCTVHAVRPEMDEGPILGQAVVPVAPDDTEDTLAARVLAAEHRLYPEVVARYARGDIRIEGERAIVSETVDTGWSHLAPGCG
ncbi:MAG: phosphoribosylglycinamide formyltransferase [Hyphomicrobium sp.]|nr:phosphoribosylglycinamide formyltransferase [Hyphomicrobium sp.]